MVSIKYLRAAKKFGPGYFIREQMEIRGWVQEELADILGISAKHLSSILQDKQALTIENAKKLGSAFNTSPQYWLNIDNDYRLWLAQKNKGQTKEVETKAVIYSRMPVRDMIKKGWLKNPANFNELIKEVKKFWDISSIDFHFLDNLILPYFKKSEAYNQYNASYAATWFQMAKKFSNNYRVPMYNRQALEDLYSNISDFTIQDNGIKLFINELNNCGVKFFALPYLEKTYLDGASFYAKENPVIVYTARYKRIDNFWFTVAHEIAHILKHLNDKMPFFLDNLHEKNSCKEEKEANSIAAKYLKHPEILSFMQPYFSYLTMPKIEECAERIKIHPSIIIGALAFNNTISYRNLNLFKENVLEYIPGEFIHDSVFV